ncbi:hypothetical protein SAMN05216466_106192 [Paraburkholderia phenazinium]|uniref:Uncharacterized protein n=1 Tax=Paraburkholderia phenazinium TaxID=60549 RepID=A0A1G7YHL7_9BURK|nr:hypothetical protein [Paraburkholderia phenazinium]SDG96003.1 hypothetical protein SAMN05216466_106192 [Paraburkholderia phenazinium]
MTTTPFDHPDTPAAIARALLAWLLTQLDHRDGTLRTLCAADPHHAALWAALPHGWRRKTGRAFNRLVRERRRGPGEPLVWCYNLPADRPHVHARYEVLPARR